MLKHAQWGIAVCGDEQAAHTAAYWPVDCAAATQNILLAAHGKGYGAVWLGIYPRMERVAAMQELLALPAHIHVFSLIAVGFPTQEVPQPDRKDDGRIHLNRW
jgi:nitroreductase